MYAFRTALRPVGLFLPEFATLQCGLFAIADLLVTWSEESKIWPKFLIQVAFELLWV